MKEMALIVPSRGRPQSIARLCDALDETNSQVDLYVGIDPDDPEINGYESLANERNFHLVVAEQRERFGPTLNRIAVAIAPSYKYLAWCGDDHKPITPGWDQKYRDVLNELKVGVVYGNDLVQGENIATQLGFTSNIVKELGYAVPKGFVHLFIDNYFMELARSVDRLVYLPDVIVQHLHYSAGKSEEDQTYKEANSRENWTNDQIRFHKYLEQELEGDKQKLWNLIS